jgi:hypothetical protein
VFIAALLSAVAVDLKPHICLPIILFVGLTQRKMKYLLIVLLILISAHVFINIWLGSFTEMQWIQNMIGAQSSKNDSMWPEQYNIWPILDHIFSAYLFWKIVSVVTVIAIFFLLFYLSSRRKEEFIWFIVASLSMVIPYSQLYSLSLLVSITLLKILRTNISVLGYLFIMFVLVPRYWTEPKNILFLCAILVIFFIYNLFDKRQSYFENIKIVMLAILANIFIHVLNDQMILIEDLERSIVCVQIVIISFVYLLERKKFLLHFKKG